MPTPYVRFILFCAARDVPLGSAPDTVQYFTFDQEAEATAAGEAWITSPPAKNHPWYRLYGQQQDGRLAEVAGEDT